MLSSLPVGRWNQTMRLSCSTGSRDIEVVPRHQVLLSIFGIPWLITRSFPTLQNASPGSLLRDYQCLYRPSGWREVMLLSYNSVPKLTCLLSEHKLPRSLISPSCKCSLPLVKGFIQKYHMPKRQKFGFSHWKPVAADWTFLALCKRFFICNYVLVRDITPEEVLSASLIPLLLASTPNLQTSFPSLVSTSWIPLLASGSLGSVLICTPLHSC